VNRRGVTKVLAKWTACTGLTGKVRLTGRILEQCGVFIGQLESKRLRWRLEAERRAGFRDLVYQQQTITGLPGSDVVLGGTLAVDVAGQAAGEVLATYAAGGVARVVAGTGFLVVEIGSEVLDLQLDDSDFVRLEGGQQRVLGIADLLATFEADVQAGGPPTGWAVSSQALLVLTALASTPDWTANVEAAAAATALGPANGRALFGPLGLSSYLPSGCKVTALAFQALAAAAAIVPCTVVCTGTIVVPVLGEITCVQFAALCAAIGTGYTESVFEAVYNICGVWTAEAPMSRVHVPSALCGGTVTAGGPGGDLELHWKPRDPENLPQLPLTLAYGPATGGCPSGVTCPSGAVLFGNQVQSGGTLALPGVMRCDGTLDEPKTIPVQAFIREAGDGRESRRVRCDLRCLPQCGAARAPLCGGSCPGGEACQPVSGIGCTCIPSDRPTCGTAPVCTDSLCPAGERCGYLLFGGCGCIDDPGGDRAIDDAIPELPPGTYDLLYSVPGQFGPLLLGRFVLEDADEFRASLVTAIEQAAAAYRGSECATRVFSTPFDGQAFTLTLRFTCQDGGDFVVTDVVFELRRVR
jgi:hypothetical protein